MPGSVANRRLLTPRSLRDALRMLDAEGSLTPMAGCTDLYVALNFGALPETNFLNLWELDERPLHRMRRARRVGETFDRDDRLAGRIADEAGRLAADAAQPISDIRSSADYRRHIVRVLTSRMVTLAATRAAAA